MIIYLVDFERIAEGEDPFDNLEEEEMVSVIPYESRTRILKQKVLGQAERDKLFEATFCWVCGNFSFSYPSGSEWLDTSAALQKVMEALMPIPREELERFYKKFPGLGRRGTGLQRKRPQIQDPSQTQKRAGVARPGGVTGQLPSTLGARPKQVAETIAAGRYFLSLSPVGSGDSSTLSTRPYFAASSAIM
ncbi:MAG: hypothetical protein ACR2RV_01270 [Verrucomicrobiales bacterium]